MNYLNFYYYFEYNFVVVVVLHSIFHYFEKHKIYLLNHLKINNKTRFKTYLRSFVRSFVTVTFIFKLSGPDHRLVAVAATDLQIYSRKKKTKKIFFLFTFNELAYNFKNLMEKELKIAKKTKKHTTLVKANSEGK